MYFSPALTHPARLMMELLLRVEDRHLEDRLRRAATLLSFPVRRLRSDACPPEPRAGHPQILVHDLEPDPVARLSWLERTFRRHRHLTLYLVLPFSADHVGSVVAHGASLPIVGVELWRPTLTAELLAERLRGCATGVAYACATWRAVEGWSLPPPLRYLCRTALRRTPMSASLQEVLQSSGVAYETARRAAARSGLPTPRRMLEALRLVLAIEALGRGARVMDVAHQFGFNDADHLRERLRCQFGVTPTEARRAGSEAYLRILEERWCAMQQPERRS
jgi:AraC-like DNA-binding protein